MADKTTWVEMVTAPLPQKKVRAKIADDNPQWEFIDGEMVKLGSLGHASLNVAQIQQAILTLLAQESKDFRLIAHLLRTLQHGGQPQDIILAVQLLCVWVEHYWSVAWPDNKVMKHRLAQQVIKRFAAAVSNFSGQADHQQHQDMLTQLERLTVLWPAGEKALVKDISALSDSYRREVISTMDQGSELTTAETPAAGSPPQKPAPLLEIDNHNDKAWRHTQLRMAEILCEQQPDNPSGYCLRRNAIWHGITSAPQSQKDGRTPLAAFSADRMAEYLGRMSTPDNALWQQVEQSLIRAPFWFDGHRLSAEIARLLGLERVAGALREELSLFLQRLPLLRELTFNDRTPFLSMQTCQWLDEQQTEQQRALCASEPPPHAVAIDEGAVWQCWQQQGLEAALQLINTMAQRLNPRGQFYCQLLSARLLDKAGMAALAQQNYRHLYQRAQGITLPEWEPDLLMQLQLQLAEQQINSKG